MDWLTRVDRGAPSTTTARIGALRGARGGAHPARSPVRRPASRDAIVRGARASTRGTRTVARARERTPVVRPRYASRSGNDGASHARHTVPHRKGRGWCRRPDAPSGAHLPVVTARYAPRGTHQEVHTDRSVARSPDTPSCIDPRRADRRNPDMRRAAPLVVAAVADGKRSKAAKTWHQVVRESLWQPTSLQK